ncbi:MAG: hypothetical protein Q8L23_07015 [Caulobacter sp.]|nr:hypothetical protein [Caulobacter sp.]
MFLILAAAASSVLLAPPPPAAGLAYAEAFARAQRYEETDNGAMLYRARVLYPWLGPNIPRILDACLPTPRPADLPARFTLVLSFKKGRFEALLSDSDHPVAQCLVKQMTPMLWPAPPFDDFAEEMRFDLKGEGE